MFSIVTFWFDFQIVNCPNMEVVFAGDISHVMYSRKEALAETLPHFARTVVETSNTAKKCENLIEINNVYLQGHSSLHMLEKYMNKKAIQNTFKIFLKNNKTYSKKFTGAINFINLVIICSHIRLDLEELQHKLINHF